MSLADVVPHEILLYLERFASEALPGRYRADIARSRVQIREIEK